MTLPALPPDGPALHPSRTEDSSGSTTKDAPERSAYPGDPPAPSALRDCFWRVETAERFSVIVDAAEYFGALRQAMLDAEHSILLIGWDFDARIRFVRDASPPEDDGPEHLGDFILWLAKRRPHLQIRLLRWATGALASMLRGTTLLTVLRWKAHPQITLRLDGRHPIAGSHHQKIVAIDDRLAFCGGIDTTLNRWDTPEHLDDDPRRVGPGGKPHPPWHDVSCAFDGPAALAIGDLARRRWAAATGQKLPPCPDLPQLWPKGLVSDLRGVTLGIARTLPKYDAAPPVHEVEQAAIALIRSARRHIYCENQYFASRRIAQAIAERLVEPDGPEIVVICPASAEGWLEPLAMNTARARLIGALARIDAGRRLRLYHPVTAGGADIYVHAKVMVVDDAYLRVGSSNFNNRSMRLDSECDVVVLEAEAGARANGAEGAQDAGVAEAEGFHCPHIATVRNALLAEHLGATPEAVAATLAETGSLIETIEALRGDGRRLIPYERPVLSGLEEWLADNEILDPDGPEEMFELTNRRGLFRGWRGVLRRRLELRRARRRQRKVLAKEGERPGGALRKLRNPFKP